MTIAYEATEEDFVRWENAWGQLIPQQEPTILYPEDFGYELLFNPNFQSQLDAAGKVIERSPSLEGTIVDPLRSLWYRSVQR